jgi:hypothetical protein
LGSTGHLPGSKSRTNDVPFHFHTIISHRRPLWSIVFPLGRSLDKRSYNLHYCGVSRLTAKLIKRRMSEKTCFVALASPRGGVSEPEGVLLMGGDASAPKSASPAPMPGDATRLLFGAVTASALVVEGSISSSVRNDVCSSSSFVLVMVTKKSSRSFCSARGVPFKSII